MVKDHSRRDSGTTGINKSSGKRNLEAYDVQKTELVLGPGFAKMVSTLLVRLVEELL